MKASRDILEVQLAEYTQQLKGLQSYIKELADKTAEHGTHSEHFEEDLKNAAHNADFYESEIVRIRALVAAESDRATYLVYEDAAGEWRWQLRGANHRILADSGEGYRRKEDCLHAIALVKDTQDAPVKERQPEARVTPA